MIPILDRLFKGQPEESDTERDGLFSYDGEVHAFFIGVGAGLASLAPGVVKRFMFRVLGINTDTKRRDVAHEVSAEPWYVMGGYFLGVTLGVVIYSASFKAIGLSPLQSLLGGASPLS